MASQDLWRRVAGIDGDTLGSKLISQLLSTPTTQRSADKNDLLCPLVQLGSYGPPEECQRYARIHIDFIRMRIWCDLS